MKEAKGQTLRVQDYDMPLTGYYLDTRTVNTSNGTQKVHSFFIDKENRELEFWGFSQLDQKLSSVPIKSRIKITYLGKKEIEDDKTMHKVRVLYDNNDLYKKQTQQAIDDDIPF